MNCFVASRAALGCAAVAILLDACAVPARATDFFWQSFVGGPFDTSALWLPFNPLDADPILGPGGAGDTVTFDLGVAPANRYTVTDVAGQNDRLLVRNDSLTLNLSGNYALLESGPSEPSFAVGISAGDSGDLILTGSGGLQTERSSIALAEGSSGAVTVDGLQWTGNGDLNIGFGGTGVLTVKNGGSVSHGNGYVGAGNTSNGEVTVTGAGSSWTGSTFLRIGVGGTGKLTIQDGGHVSNTAGLLGDGTASSGEVVVTGAGSTWANSSVLDVGLSGAGMLTIQDGGSVSNTNGTIGAFAGPNSTVMVTGAGSSWTNFGTLDVGENGEGTLMIQGGGRVSNTTGTMGKFSTGSGSVTVTGAGSTWTNSSALNVGLAGTGTLTIQDGGQVHVGSTLFIGSSGALNLNGGTLRFDGYSRNGTFSYIAGTIQLAGDRTVGTDAAISDLFGATPTLGTGKGLTIEGVATLLTPVTVDGGALSVGEIASVALVDFRRGTLAITNQTVSIEPGGLFGETLELSANQTLNVALGIANQGLVTGDGQLGGPFHNEASGELRAEPGRSLTLTGAGNTNDGQVYLFGGLLEFTEDLANNAGAFISGNGTLIVGGDLVNHGTMNFSGAANVVGDVNNAAGGLIIASGGGPTTFHDDVTNNGEIRTSAGAFTVFFGSVDGAGSFTGLGTVNFEGDLRPGNSPTALSFEGNAVFGDHSRLAVELSGLQLGAEHDHLNVTGQLALNGTLEVLLTGGFAPRSGDTFNLFDFGALSGQFGQLNLPLLNGSRRWDISNLYTTGVLAVVPEPATMWGVTLLVLAALPQRRKKALLPDPEEQEAVP